MSTVKEEAIKLRKNIDEVYEAGRNAEYDRFWDTYQDNGNRKKYSHAFGGIGWSINGMLPPKYPIVLDAGYTTNSSIFANFNNAGSKRYDMSEICSMLDCSRAKVLSYMFQDAAVENITIDISNCETANNMFNCANGGGNIDKVYLKVTEKLKAVNNMFRYCSYLRTIIFTEDSVITVSLGFPQSDLLSDESVDSIINALQDRTGMTALTITFHTTVVDKLTDEQIALISAKNWRIG